MDMVPIIHRIYVLGFMPVLIVANSHSIVLLTFILPSWMIMISCAKSLSTSLKSPTYISSISGHSGLGLAANYSRKAWVVQDSRQQYNYEQPNTGFIDGIGDMARKGMGCILIATSMKM